jgi:hypothetical protein
MRKTVKLKGGTRGTHGGYSYLVTGRLPAHRNAVERYLTAARQGLVYDLGPKEEDLTTAQIILIDRSIGKLGVLRCIEEFVRETSVMKGADLAPCLGRSYLAYSNSLRLDLQALGVNTRAGEKFLTPLQIAAEIDAEKEAKVESAGGVPDGSGEEDGAGDGETTS